MQLVALVRGTPTSEQEAVIEEQMRAITATGDDLAARMVYVRHAATQAVDADTAIDHLAPLLRENSTPPSATISNACWKPSPSSIKGRPIGKSA